ncbi:transglycosylase SLT domain-containing protein [Providencia hangzhouensis]|uniref:transglycosylase SLT domain-containing protein n=1 Tax=Providencia hangzhouensis TaxID=3031799 RepID=UPI003979D6D1
MTHGSFRESSFQPNAINDVQPTRYAIGLMQIHSQNFNELAQYGIRKIILRKDPCMNIYTGAFYLAKFIFAYKGIFGKGLAHIMQG